VGSYFVENFGCRATQADGATIERQLLDRGLSRAESPGEAEIVVLNTCTVTASADQDVRAAIRRIHRQSPATKILVTGCYAQRAPEELSALPGVRLVVGNSHKHAIGDYAAPLATPSGFVPLGQVGPAESDEQTTEIVKTAVASGAEAHAEEERNDLNPGLKASTTQETSFSAACEVIVGDIFAHTELLAASVFDGEDPAEKTRPNLKVQDGCNNRCSFCIIPFVRGRSRSLQLEHVIRETESLVARGYREIVLSGINLGRWGKELTPRMSFAAMLRAILASTTIEKLRISSVEPMDWTNELIELVAREPRIAKHAHVPLQSGSDKILRRMHRKYRPWHYADRIERIRSAMPDAAIGADVMVGFPGETEDDFEQTRVLIERLPFTYLHVFTYSSRPGTPSATMAEQVPVQVARERNRILRDLAARKKRRFMKSFIGRELDVLTLTNYDGSRTEALSENYVKVFVTGSFAANQIVRVNVSGVDGDWMTGTHSNMT
jgi:threonylcarbamoyladenosine tRNA methylthiotransferase MtaB